MLGRQSVNIKVAYLAVMTAIVFLWIEDNIL